MNTAITPFGGSKGSTDERAQTIPDFVIGIAIFLLVVAFVVTFVPEITAPYDEQDSSIVADRVSADVAGQHLGTNASPETVNTTCTIAFFTATAHPNCQDATQLTLNEHFELSERYNVNVSLRNNASDGPESTVLCGDDGTIDTCGTEHLERGTNVPKDGASVAVSRQVILVEDTYAVLEVRVWTS